MAGTRATRHRLSVYVTDLPVHEPGVGYPWESYAHEFLDIVDDGWEGEGERVFRPTPVTERTLCHGYSGISLREPSVITTVPAARFRFRVSTALERDLEYQGISRRRHAYMRSLYLGYDYFLTPAQAAAGWEDDPAPTLVESAEFGGRIGDDEWLIRFEGDGQATLVNRSSGGEPGETEAFTIEADTWYLLELDGTGDEARVTLFLAAGDEPGAQVATTTRSRSAPGAPWDLVIWSDSELWADALEVSVRLDPRPGRGQLRSGRPRTHVDGRQRLHRRLAPTPRSGPSWARTSWSAPTSRARRSASTPRGRRTCRRASTTGSSPRPSRSRRRAA